MNTNIDSVSGIGALLKQLSIKLGELLQSIQTEHSIVSVLLLLLFSLLYGIIHAAGPGHGKTLVASYFSANDRDYKKAIVVALAIAIVHTFSAFAITLMLYYLFQNLFSVALVNISNIAIKISGGLIIAIGLYLLYTKIMHYKNQKHTKWSAAPQSSCNCASCNTKNQSDIILILAAGLVPCPGTITVFLFSISLGLYFIGFLSAIAMSLGMGLIIAITALISTKVRKISKNRYTKILKILDFVAVGIIICLGGILLIT